jgi:hypothetical protein
MMTVLDRKSERFKCKKLNTEIIVFGSLKLDDK